MSNISKVTRNFALAVREMRSHQKEFFSARTGTPAKANALKNSVAAEKKVDEMLKVVFKTIEALESQESKESE